MGYPPQCGWTVIQCLEGLNRMKRAGDSWVLALPDCSAERHIILPGTPVSQAFRCELKSVLSALSTPWTTSAASLGLQLQGDSSWAFMASITARVNTLFYLHHLTHIHIHIYVHICMLMVLFLQITLTDAISIFLSIYPSKKGNVQLRELEQRMIVALKSEVTSHRDHCCRNVWKKMIF